MALAVIIPAKLLMLVWQWWQRRRQEKQLISSIRDLGLIPMHRHEWEEMRQKGMEELREELRKRGKLKE